MNTLSQPPEGIEPFDYNNDGHLSAVNRYITASEEALYGVNAMLGLTIKRSDGIRMDHDIVVVQSLIHPEKRSVFLSFGLCTTCAQGPTDSREIAGVLNGTLWFEQGGKFFTADEELERNIQFAKKLASPLKDVLNPIREALEELKKDIERKRNDGEEWKGE